MAERYYEIVVTARQLVMLVVGLAVLIVVAFGFGVGVGLRRPAAEVPQTAVPPPSWTPLPWPTVPARPAAEVTAGGPTVVPSPTATLPPIPAAAAAVPTPVPTTPAAASRPASPTASGAPPASPARWVQVAALSRHPLAEGVRNRVIALGFTPRQVMIQAEAGTYRVRLGPFPDLESARRVEGRLKAEGFPDAFVVKLGE